MKHRNSRSTHLKAWDRIVPSKFPSNFTTSNFWHFCGIEVVGYHPKLIFHFALETCRMWGWNMYYIEVDNQFYFISYCSNLGSTWSDCWKAKKIDLTTMNLAEINQYAIGLFNADGGYKHNYLKFKDIP